MLRLLSVYVAIHYQSTRISSFTLAVELDEGVRCDLLDKVLPRELVTTLSLSRQVQGSNDIEVGLFLRRFCSSRDLNCRCEMNDGVDWLGLCKSIVVCLHIHIAKRSNFAIRKCCGQVCKEGPIAGLGG